MECRYLALYSFVPNFRGVGGVGGGGGQIANSGKKNSKVHLITIRE